MKRYICLVLSAMLLLYGCSYDAEVRIKKISDYTKPVVLNADDSYFPDFEVSSRSENREAYENVTPQELSEYIDSLIDEGFQCKRDIYSALLYMPGVMIHITDNTKSYNKCSVTVYIAMKTESDSALTEAEALNVIDDDKVFFLLDQTPEGFYEATGTRYFYAPVHSFNYLTYEETHIPENSHYVIMKCLVTEKGYVFVDSPISAPVVCDVNNDNVRDIIFLGYGPTSGLFTITLTMYNIIDGVPVLDSCNIYQLSHGDIDIGLNDMGKPVLFYCPNNSDEYTEYLIGYSDKLIVGDMAFQDWELN